LRTSSFKVFSDSIECWKINGIIEIAIRLINKAFQDKKPQYSPSKGDNSQGEKSKKLAFKLLSVFAFKGYKRKHVH